MIDNHHVYTLVQYDTISCPRQYRCILFKNWALFTGK